LIDFHIFTSFVVIYYNNKVNLDIDLHFIKEQVKQDILIWMLTMSSLQLEGATSAEWGF